MTPFDLGYAAYKTGNPNPFVEGTDDYEEFEEGLETAYEDDLSYEDDCWDYWEDDYIC